jgi:bifunctional DNA-binding transcriptional regulator/antitoxin component of YhaV-PrlF toxin-antitoxin module
MAIGYKGVRAGSRKEHIRRIFDSQGAEAARSEGRRQGLKQNTLRTWFSHWKHSAENGFEEGETKWDGAVPERLNLELGPGGRVVIPAVYRKAMQVDEGDRLMASVVDGELRLITPRMSIKLAQKMVRETIPGEDSLVDTLVEMRRQEYRDEFGDD